MTDNPQDVSDPTSGETSDEASGETPSETSNETSDPTLDQTSAVTPNEPSDVTSDETSIQVEDWVEGDDLPVAQVRELFMVLGKALRSFQLYDENNPVRKRFINSLREAFQQLWQEVEGLNLSVEEDRLLLVGEEVYRNTSHTDSLAFLFYKDGVRDITFLPGIEGEELDDILGVLQRARMLKTAEADDLLTMLWEQDLDFFKCRSVDQITEGALLPVAQAVEQRADLGQVLQDKGEASQAETDDQDKGDASQAETDDTEGEAGSTPPKAVDDFSPDLYALDPVEKEELQLQLAAEMARDLRHDVLSALFDRLEEAEYYDRKSEILRVLRELLPTLLSRGAVESAADVLQELAAVRSEPGVFDEVRQTECDELLDDLSARGTIEELVRALQDGTIDVSIEVLARFLKFLRAGALPVLLEAAEREGKPALKNTLRGAVQGIASAHPDALLGLLEDVNPVVTSGAVRLVGELGVSSAAPKLVGLMMHPDAVVRLALVEAAQVLRDQPLTDTLITALSDSEQDVRVAAARALVALAHESAAPALEALVTGKEIREADLTEKIAIFESYGVLGGGRQSVLWVSSSTRRVFSVGVSPLRSEPRPPGPWGGLGFRVRKRLCGPPRRTGMSSSAPRCGRRSKVSR